MRNSSTSEAATARLSSTCDLMAAQEELEGILGSDSSTVNLVSYITSAPAILANRVRVQGYAHLD